MSIRKKFISGSPAEAIDGSKILLQHNEALRAKNESGSAEDILKIEGAVLKLLKVPQVSADPSASNDLVRKSFIDGQVSTLQSAISAEQTARISGDNALDARLDIVEPKLSVIESNLSTEKATAYENLAAIYADGQPGVQDPSYRDGWYFKNAVAGQKINWYFYDGQAENTTLGNMSSVYAVLTVDSLSSLPIIAIYTTPTGSGDAQVWYKSRKVFSAPSAGLVVGKKYLFYAGAAPSVHPELQRVQMTVSNSSEGTQGASERVLSLALNSNSGAAVNNVQWCVESVGFESPAIHREIALRIRKASVAELAAEALARQSADSTEQAARIAGDGVLAGRLDIVEPKVSTLEGKMTAVEGRASSLEGRATSLETSVGILNGNSTVSGSVDAKVKAAVDGILGGVDGAFDTLQEIAQYISSDQGAGTALVGRVGVLEGKVSTLQGDKDTVGSVLYSVDQEKIRAMAAESGIQTDLNGEKTLRASEITRVEGLISTEASARVSGDNALDARLDILESDKTVSGSVAYAVEQEKIRAMAAESAEQTARISGDNALDARLDILESDKTVSGSVAYAVEQEKQRAMAAEIVLESTLSTEQAARISGDNALGARLTTLEASSSVQGSVAYAVAQEAALRASGDSSLQSQITAEITARQDADALLANKQLSNLGTTSINAEILPDGNGTRNIGSTTLNWNAIHSRTQFLYTSTGVQAAQSGANFTTPSALTGASGISLLSGASGVLALMTANNGSATKAIRLETGNATAANFNSGDIALQTGTVSGTGVRGKVILSGSTIEPQASVIPNVNALYDLGSGSLRFRNLYVSASVSLSNGSIQNNIQTPSNVFSLGMTASNVPVSVFTGSKAAGAGSSVDVLIESGNSADAASGSIKLRTGTAGTTRGKVEVAALSLDMGSAKIESLAGGVASTDAVNKGQLDAGVTEAKGYTDTKFSAEQSARIAGDNALDDRLDVLEPKVSTLESKMTAVEGRATALETSVGTLNGNSSVSGSVAYSVKQAIDALVAGAPSAYDTLLEISQYIASDASAGASMLSQLNDHEQRLDTLEGADSVVGSVAYSVKAERVRAMAAESAIQGEVDAEELLRASEITRVEGLVTTEQNARIAGDNALDGRLDILEGADTVVGSVAKAKKDAITESKSYTDAQLDTLVIQQQQYVAKTLVSDDITAQYVDVSGPIQGTPWIMIDGVMGRPNEDFTWSGSRILFAGEWASAGASALVEGDVLHIFFMKNYSPFV